MFVPDNRPWEGDWYWIDVAAIAQQCGLPPETPLIEVNPPSGRSARFHQHSWLLCVLCNGRERVGEIGCWISDGSCHIPVVQGNWKDRQECKCLGKSPGSVDGAFDYSTSLTSIPVGLLEGFCDPHLRIYKIILHRRC